MMCMDLLRLRLLMTMTMTMKGRRRSCRIGNARFLVLVLVRMVKVKVTVKGKGKGNRAHHLHFRDLLCFRRAVTRIMDMDISISINHTLIRHHIHIYNDSKRNNRERIHSEIGAGALILRGLCLHLSCIRIRIRRS